MKNWQKVWLESEKAWYMTSGDQWITYENVDSAIMKASDHLSSSSVSKKNDIVFRHNTPKQSSWQDCSSGVLIMTVSFQVFPS